MTAIPKAAADFGDNLVDAILDAIDREPPELRDRLLVAIKSGDYATEGYPDRVVAKFPAERIEYVVPLVRIPPSTSDRLN
jgi:hypothetical protein